MPTMDRGNSRMVAYSFKKQFIEPIRAGLKTQTIRAPRKRHARIGEAVSLYWGMRTAQCTRIIPDPRCSDVMAVVIEFDRARIIHRILTDGVPVRDLDAFAIRDGFKDILDMSDFWALTHNQRPGEVFEGVLIEWAAQVIGHLSNPPAAV